MTLAFDLVGEGNHQFEKIEGLSLLPHGRIAVVNDNDFGVTGPTETISPTMLSIFPLLQ